MLTKIRKRSGSILVKALLGLLILSFAAWGIQDIFVSNLSRTAVAEVGDEEISVNQFQNVLRNEMNRLRPVLGNNFTMDQARQFGLLDMVLEQQIGRMLIDKGARDLGVMISDKLIREEIHNNPTFQTIGNKFDKFRFNQLLQANGLSEAQYIADFRQSLSASQYVDSLQAGGVAPKILVDTLYRYRQEKRIADILVVPDTAMVGIADPDESTVKDYYESNSNDFMAPEYREATYVHLQAADIAPRMSISEDELVQGYDARIADYSKAEQRTVLQMIVENEEKADEVAKKLAEGQDFAAVAKEMAGQDETSLELGPISHSDLLPDLGTPVFATALGEITNKVKSPLGWHIFKISAINPGGTKSLDDVRVELQQELALEKALDDLFGISNQLEDQLGGGASLEEAAAALDLKIEKVGAMDQTRRDSAEKPISNIPGGAAFVNAVFSLEEGQESPITDGDKDTFFIVRLDSITQVAVKPLTDVHDQVVDSWLQQQRAEKAEKTVTEMVSKINQGTDLAEVAGTLNLSPSRSLAITREGTKATAMDQGTIEQMFALEINRAAMVRTSNGYEIAVLKEVLPADPDSDLQGVISISNSTSNAIKTDIYSQLANALRNEYGVTINQNILSQVINSSGS